MKTIRQPILAFLLIFPSLIYAVEPLDTQYTTGGLETHLLKVSVSNSILTIAFMVENPADKSYTLYPAFNPNEVAYVAGDKRYPALKDANDQWMLSPYGPGQIFDERTKKIIGGTKLSISGGGRIVGWVKFEAPAADAWPIDLALPQTSPFTIEKPN